MTDTNEAKDGGWMATIEFRSTEAMAFGATPEAAMRALIESWQESCETWDRGEPLLVHEYREDVKVLRFALGKGYVQGVTDDRWFKDMMSGSDSAFDDVFQELVGPLAPRT